MNTQSDVQGIVMQIIVKAIYHRNCDVRVRSTADHVKSPPSVLKGNKADMQAWDQKTKMIRGAALCSRITLTFMFS